jgi:hypothetical protein
MLKKHRNYNFLLVAIAMLALGQNSFAQLCNFGTDVGTVANHMICRYNCPAPATFGPERTRTEVDGSTRCGAAHNGFLNGSGCSGWSPYDCFFATPTPTPTNTPAPTPPGACDPTFPYAPPLTVTCQYTCTNWTPGNQAYTGGYTANNSRTCVQHDGLNGYYYGIPCHYQGGPPPGNAVVSSCSLTSPCVVDPGTWYYKISSPCSAASGVLINGTGVRYRMGGTRYADSSCTTPISDGFWSTYSAEMCSYQPFSSGNPTGGGSCPCPTATPTPNATATPTPAAAWQSRPVACHDAVHSAVASTLCLGPTPINQQMCPGPAANCTIISGTNYGGCTAVTSTQLAYGQLLRGQDCPSSGNTCDIVCGQNGTPASYNGGC